ncbi:NAD(P)H-dependent oxidoreductase [Roseibacillus ishigakijimensis]|uniref:NAD(P)H-dependent oxidoreductase n=1 Tax=Roseibacillus ishigakijimensis TaxID=454146 RepID=A0A934RPR1_9BACT|nr:NAD(P)H-dependent oxidoreductase [Roseibacillus ishigakijimensis]MBK1835229.1 NAD(P)H-dependent oxidoreductase [Roseibacillus ishigakijimensis]
MRETLLIFVHPAWDKSRVNRALLEGVADLPNLTVHDLYEEYPHFDIVPEREQELLCAHQRIVWQHPLFWYSTPALLKEWFDVVLQYGWAYGSEGKCLHQKDVLSAITTGSPLEAYQANGLHRYPLPEFLRPLEQTCRLCGMNYEEPFLVPGALTLSGSELDAAVGRYRNRLLES